MYTQSWSFLSRYSSIAHEMLLAVRKSTRMARTSKDFVGLEVITGQGEQCGPEGRVSSADFGSRLGPSDFSPPTNVVHINVYQCVATEYRRGMALAPRTANRRKGLPPSMDD